MLSESGFGFKRNLSRSYVGRSERDRVMERIVYAYVIKDGLNVAEAVARALKDSESVHI